MASNTSPPTVSEESKQNDTSLSGHVFERTNILASVTYHKSVTNDNSNTIDVNPTPSIQQEEKDNEDVGHSNSTSSKSTDNNTAISKSNGTCTDPKAISHVVDDNNNNIINNSTSINTNLAQVQHEEREQKETEHVEKPNGAYRDNHDNDSHEATSTESSESNESVGELAGLKILQSVIESKKNTLPSHESEEKVDVEEEHARNDGHLSNNDNGDIDVNMFDSFVNLSENDDTTVHDTGSNEEDIHEKSITTVHPMLPPNQVDNSINTSMDSQTGSSVSRGKQIPVPPPGASLVIPPAAIAAGGSQSKIFLPEINRMIPENTNLKPQQGLSQKSALLCPNIYLYNHYTLDEKLKYFSNIVGPFALAKIVQVPNGRKMVDTYTVKYHDVHGEEDMDGWVTELPKNNMIKKYLIEGVDRANKIHWRYKDTKIKRTKSNVSKSRKSTKKTKTMPSQVEETNTTLLSGILEEENDSDYDSTNDEHNEKESSVPENVSNTDSSSGEEGSECDVFDSAFDQVARHDSDLEEGRTSPNKSTTDEEDIENLYLGGNWKWNNWEPHDIDEEIEGPTEHDHYSGPHGLKPNICKRFFTVLQCLFETTAMDRDFFVRLCCESNKYARKVMKERNTSLFLGHKWNNISVTEMIHFFGIMLRISLEPRKMGGYESYFVEDQSITLCNGYSATLRGYNAWAKDIMTLLRFKQIRSAFRSECDRFDPNDKCYQLRWFIRKFNFMARKTFHLGPNAAFDEGGISMRSRYCPVRQYNKDKPAKYRVDFFILADSRDYFIYHLDVYQGKNTANIDIHPSVRRLPTTQKAVANAILKSKINNDKDGCRYLFMDNRYAAPQLFALMLTNYNIRGVGTCKANRLGFESEQLQLKKDARRGSYMRLHDKRLGMIITRWKDSKNLQTVSTVMKHGAQMVKRRNGAKLIDVQCPNDIILYQQNMGGVDRGDQHRIVGAGFSNVAHFKKWYKKAFLGVADFSLLQAFTAWNLSVDQIRENRRGNSEVKRKKLIKWQFYSVLAEELMMYVDSNEDNDTLVGHSKSSVNRMMQGHVPASYFNFDKEERTSRPLCMICSMDEMARAQVLQLTRSKSKNRKFARRTKYIVKCMHENCPIVAHATIQDNGKVSSLPCFGGMTCFEIAHHPRCKDLFTVIKRKGKTYCRTIPSHGIVQEIKDLYSSELPRRSTREKPKSLRGKVGRPPTTITTINDSEERFESPLSGANSTLASNTANVATTRTLTRTRQQKKQTAAKRNTRAKCVQRPKRTQTVTRVTRNTHTKRPGLRVRKL